MNSPTAFATESGHWYSADGEPRYTVVGKNGNVRPTTIRDAKANGWLPSVTTIIRLMAAPGLERWKLNQFGLALLTLPRLPGESEDDFMARAARDSQEEGKRAAARGEYIHGGIERHYRGSHVDPEVQPWVDAAVGAIDALCGPQTWLPERSFASPLGYGGKVDLHSSEWVLDVKTKDNDLMALFDDHYVQLAAYDDGLGRMSRRCGIVFVNRREPSAVAIEASEDNLRKGWAIFKALLALHQAKTGYRPA